MAISRTKCPGEALNGLFTWSKTNSAQEESKVDTLRVVFGLRGLCIVAIGLHDEVGILLQVIVLGSMEHKVFVCPMAASQLGQFDLSARPLHDILNARWQW